MHRPVKVAHSSFVGRSHTTKNMGSGLCLLPPAFLACDIAANYASVNVPLKRPGGVLDARTYLKKIRKLWKYDLSF